MKQPMNKETKHLLVHGAIYLFLFNLMPLMVGGGDEASVKTLLMYVFPAACAVLSILYAKMVGMKAYYFLVAPLCYLPSVFLLAPKFSLYQNDAYTYLIVILLFTLVGYGIGYFVIKAVQLGDRTAIDRSRTLRKKK